MRGQRRRLGDFRDVRRLGGKRAQELAARGHVEEEVAHLDGRALCGAARLEDRRTASPHEDLDSGVVFTARLRSANRLTDAMLGSASPRKPYEDPRQISSAILARRVPLGREQGVVVRHSVAVVAHPNEADTSRFDVDPDPRGVRVDGVFDELFRHAGRSLHDLAGGDLIGEVIGESMDDPHRLGLLLSRPFGHGAKKRADARPREREEPIATMTSCAPSPTRNTHWA